jgi:hypothetical protein
MDWLGEKYGFVTPEDWYQLQNTHFLTNHGGTLLNRVYDSSVQNALKDYRPGYKWIPWLFSKTPKGFWHQAANRLAYMSWLERRLKIRKDEDWYQVTKETFLENSGAGLFIRHYRGSVLSALTEYKPDVDWKPWLFRSVPNGFWKSEENCCRYFAWLADQLHIDSVSQWRRLSKDDLLKSGGSVLLYTRYAGSVNRLRDHLKRLEISVS